MLQFKKTKRYGSGRTTLIIPNDDLTDMIKIVKAPEDSDALMKGVTETLKSDVKKGGFLSTVQLMLIGTEVKLAPYFRGP